MNREAKRYIFDAVIVLCGGIYAKNGLYYPTTFAHSDNFGMLGGDIRVDAAMALYLQGKTQNILFSAGASAKSVAKFGPAVPPEAQVYTQAFRQRLHAQPRANDLQPPHIFVEDASPNTANSLLEVASMIAKQGWQTVAFISSDYHITRITALYELLRPDFAPTMTRKVTFLSAERIVTKAFPGTRDADIAAAYKTPEALKRIANERQGLEDMKAGRYVRSEFQLHKGD
jgi:uncharacterized SAM-binding protein YcdF (DUF218 family)